MAILHGSWVQQQQDSCLFIWGETWRSQAGFSANLLEVSAHPLAMTPDELRTWLSSQNPAIANLLAVSSRAIATAARTGASTFQA